MVLHGSLWILEQRETTKQEKKVNKLWFHSKQNIINVYEVLALEKGYLHEGFELIWVCD